MLVSEVISHTLIESGTTVRRLSRPVQGRQTTGQVCLRPFFFSLHSNEEFISARMKTLLLIRHAKSSWKQEGLPDMYRPLSGRGHMEAENLANRLVSERISPDLLLTSPSVRTYTTALYLSHRLQIPFECLLIKDCLYESTTTDYTALIKTLDSSVSCVALFGHNETISELYAKMIRQEGVLMKTGDCAVLDFQITDWSEFTRSNARIRAYFSSPAI